MIDVGDTVSLTYPALPAGATAVTVTIVLPDGTATTPTSALSGSYSYPTVQAGRHTVLWQATSPAGTDSYADVFEVASSAASGIISLADAKTQLRVQKSDNDEELRLYISAATDMIEDMIGAVVVKPVTETLGALNSIVLTQQPVISLSSMLTTQGVDLSSYFTLNGTAGLLSLNPTSIGYPFAQRAYVWPGQPLDRLYFQGLLPFYPGQPLTISYKAGRPVVPASIQLAARVIVEHLWQTRRLAGVQPASAGDEQVTMTGIGYAMPDRAAELLAPFTRAPVVA